MNFFRFIIKRVSKQEIDPQIKNGYILRFTSEKILCLIYGILRFKKLKLIFCHPSTIIKGSSSITLLGKVNIDRNCYIDALSSEGLNIGDNVSIGRNTSIQVTGSLRNLGKGITIGKNVGLGTNGYYGGAGGVKIGDDTIFGNFVSVHPENHNFANLDLPIRLQGVNHKGIIIGKGCWIGAKATILDGTIIGDGCIVAAGAVVTGHFPDNVIIGGVPAKIIKSRIDN